MILIYFVRNIVVVTPGVLTYNRMVLTTIELIHLGNRIPQPWQPCTICMDLFQGIAYRKLWFNVHDKHLQIANKKQLGDIIKQCIIGVLPILYQIYWKNSVFYWLQSKILLFVNTLWRSDAIWRHRSGSALAQVMAWCHQAISHCLNQCWAIIRGVLWHSTDSNLTSVHKLNWYLFWN